MDVKLQNVETNVVELEIQLGTEEFEEGLQKSFLKNSKKFNIPGFRKGKAPRKIVERYFGVEVLYEDAVNFLYPEAYDKAIKQENLFPVSLPEIDIKDINNEEGFIFTAKVTVKPEVNVSDYKGVEVEDIKYEVTDDVLEKEFHNVLEDNARIISIEDRPVESGDITIIDFEGFVDGEPFEGGKASNYKLEIGSGSFIDNFEDQLIGKNIDDEFDVSVKFPENYGKKELEGKDAIFKVKINEIKHKELPVADDEFAKDVSEFDTLLEYKADLKSKLEKKMAENAKREKEDLILQKITEKTEIDIPHVMIEKRIEELYKNFAMTLRYQGLDIDSYTKHFGMSIEDIKEGYKEQAEKEIKTQLVLEKISILENIEVNDEEFDEYLKTKAEERRKTYEEFKSSLKDEAIEYMKDILLVEKTVNMLYDNAVFVESKKED